MPDYYTEFSFLVKNLTDEEKWWFEDILVCPATAHDFDTSEKEKGEDELREELEAWLDKYELNPNEEYDYWPGCEWSFETSATDTSIWFRSEQGSGDVSSLIEILHRFVTRFRPEDIISFEWAYTCSRPREDAFGGGAAVISFLETEYNSTGVWVQEMNSKLFENTDQVFGKGLWPTSRMSALAAQTRGLFKQVELYPTVVLVPVWVRIIEDLIFGKHKNPDKAYPLFLEEVDKALHEPIRKMAYLVEHALNNNISERKRTAVLANLEEVRKELKEDD